MKIKFTKKNVLAALIILGVLAAAFFFGGNYGKEAAAGPSAPANSSAEAALTATIPPGSSSDVEISAGTAQNEAAQAAKPASQTALQSPAAGGASASTDVNHQMQSGAPSSSAAPSEAGSKAAAASPSHSPVQDSSAASSPKTCTLSVSCKTILDNLSKLDPAKRSVLPENGVILSPVKAVFFEGESVFNVLQRELKKAGIPWEFEKAPLQNSIYIEGIGNLYEQDCGELSGWMFKVNGSFPRDGCGQYLLRDGDIAEWVYTCDLGRDVGGDYASNKGIH